MIYLATPFSKSEDLQKQYDKIVYTTTKLMEKEYQVISPVIHNCPLVKHLNGYTGWEYFREYNLELLKGCDLLWVIKFDGWDKSVSVKDEIDFAKKNRIVIEYVDVVNEHIMSELKLSIGKEFLFHSEK